MRQQLRLRSNYVHIRISAVPLKIDIGKIGELVLTSGIVVRVSQPTVMKLKKRFICKKCKHINAVKLEWEKQTFRSIKHCEACRSESLTVSTSLEQDDCSDYQEIRIQDKYKTDTRSYYSVGLQVVLLDDLVDKCKPGDKIDVSGIIIRKWGKLKAGHRAEATTFLMANSISVCKKITDAFSTAEIKDTFTAYWEHYQNNMLSGRNNILASICPQLYGMYISKLALAVVMCGGVSKTNESGTRIRGEPHLLLVGDPGTGKSQLLRVASRLATRSVFTTGVGSTAAGLTAAAVKDSDGWHLEAGALVLADGGVCCVDEFTTMSSHDRTSVHEAMEQQTISIAKAGMVSTLNSRCSVVAAINPNGGCFTGEEWNTCLGNPLLSRFDLILLLRDTRNLEWDKLTSSHILKIACEDEENNSYSEMYKDPWNLMGLWSEETLREYFAHVRALKPVLTEEAKKILSATYLYHRSDPRRKPERTTVRLLDSLIRLAEGHAKLMYRNKVEVIDAVTAAELVGTTLLNNSDADCSFPIDPIVTYQLKAKDLLKKLNLLELESCI
ncbi:DNA helicase MCM9 isoform X3 [Cardiocondyla obscurior]|uniref:DNA helicase MCM9 isoform X3 n=1 Tax=Cardiocondyla obscurior TaxID=286306 RepID=UPI0039655C1F